MAVAESVLRGRLLVEQLVRVLVLAAIPERVQVAEGHVDVGRDLRDLLGRVPQTQATLHLLTERPVDRKTMWLGTARPPSCRTLRDHRPATAKTTVACDLPRARRHRTADPPSDSRPAAARRDTQRDFLTLLQRQTCTRHLHPSARGPTSSVQ